MLDFNGKVVFVTGANSGIGAATVTRFLESGAKVVGADIAYPSVEISKINSEENPVKIHLDIKKAKDVTQVINLVAETYGRLNVAVNAAGILRLYPILEQKEEDWDEVMAVNVKGVLFVCQAAMKVMMKQNSGSIVNIGSTSGITGGALAGADYSASKAAVICLTKSFAKAGAPYGIRVNSIAPGGINTPMSEIYYEKFPEAMKRYVATHPMKRWGEPGEVASAIVFLASDEASYMTGTCMHVNGGSLMI
jgi:3-oxoacyl-[acyl-carrier protein] reductase